MISWSDSNLATRSMRTAGDSLTTNAPVVSCNHQAALVPWDLLSPLDCSDDAVDGPIEGNQQRHIARDDLGQHAHGGADLSLLAFVSQQACQNLSPDILLVLIQRAVNPALLDCSQTMSKSVLISWRAGYAFLSLPFI